MRKFRWISAVLSVLLCLGVSATPALADDTTLNYSVSPDKLSGAGTVTLTVSVGCAVNAADLMENVTLSRSGGAQIMSFGNIQPGNTITRSATISLTADELNKDLGFVVKWSDGGVSQQKTFTVKVTKSDAAPSVDFSVKAASYTGNVGDTLEFSYTIKNTGSVEISSVKVTDFDKEIGTKTVLKPGGTQTFTYKLKLSGDATSQPKLSYVANGKTYNITLDKKEIDISRPSVQVVISSEQSQINAGDKIKLLYTIKNAGNIALGAITVSDSATGEKLYSAESLDVGATRTFQRTVTAVSTEDYACVLATTDAQGKEFKTQSNTLTIEVANAKPQYDLGITAQTETTELAQAGDVPFVLTVSNYGSSEVANVMVTDGQNNVIKIINSLAVGSQTIDYTMPVSQSGDQVFHLVVDAGTDNEYSVASSPVTITVGVEPTATPEAESPASNRLSSILIVIGIVSVLLIAALGVLLTLMLREKRRTRRGAEKYREGSRRSR